MEEKFTPKDMASYGFEDRMPGRDGGYRRRNIGDVEAAHLPHTEKEARLDLLKEKYTRLAHSIEETLRLYSPIREDLRFPHDKKGDAIRNTDNSQGVMDFSVDKSRREEMDQLELDVKEMLDLLAQIKNFK
jgi:hypothetical protein